MLEAPSTADEPSWRRYFAMLANNEAWRLAESRNASEIDALLHAAHAAAWHWNAIGTELHRMRALMLLANAHALAGDGARAMRYATRAHDYFSARPETPDWEIAIVHAVHAHAAGVAGEGATHAASYAAARDAVARIADPEDRAIVERTWQQVPPPTSSA